MCKSLHTELNFIGSHQSHECEIELDNISEADQGTWFCKMVSNYKNQTFQDQDNVQVIVNNFFSPNLNGILNNETNESKNNVENMTW